MTWLFDEWTPKGFRLPVNKWHNKKESLTQILPTVWSLFANIDPETLVRRQDGQFIQLRNDFPLMASSMEGDGRLLEIYAQVTEGLEAVKKVPGYQFGGQPCIRN